ncbi:MAG: TRAP transporter permease, partial [Pseudomonadota bacterium]
IANANPFRTGVAAFGLGLGKVVAPMAFVYAPVLLFVSSTGFDLLEFSYTAISCILGVIALSAAVVGYWLAPMGMLFRWLMGLAGIVFIAPSFQADLIALAIASPAVATQVLAHRRQRLQVPA